ncbi:hypothetical protein UFOVP27_65 [uncultured Caudovirales phage]|uniref:Uncharacterized protein n=1 Tax=uncultured Caudovirales phage TaxID=2100421 RepID=A0A6J5KPT7_9CAUD|nr:hypothetical protein UFOVP27_65 [uncultured Caudovirales phage]
MSESDPVDRLLSELDEYYPGSKKKRRPLNPQARKPKVKEEGTWDSKPQVKTLPNGNVVQLFSAGDFSLALGRPLVTVRLWERKGYIPRAPYRLKSPVVDGVKKPGWRMYSKAMVEATVVAFEARGLIEAPRIDWNRHSDLSIELMETWKKIHSQETN